MRLDAVFVVAFIGLASCSNDAAGGPACSGFTPCGGDIVGTWKLVGLCATEPPPKSCPEMTVTATGEASGSITYNADGTFGGATTMKLDWFVTVPKSCLGSATCADVATSLTSSYMKGTVCTTASASCECTATSDEISGSGSGTYRLSGSTLTTTTASGGGGSVSYCVQGSTLRWQKTGDANVTFVATR